jgi:outer membrane protein
MKKSLSTLIIAAAMAISGNAHADDLLTVYQQALRSDPVVLKAKAQFEALKEDIIQARSVLLPQIDASGSYGKRESESQNYNDSFGPIGALVTGITDTYSYGVNLNMQIYRHDSWLRMDNATKAAHRSDLSYLSSKQDLIVRVSNAYFNLLAAKDDLEFAQSEKAAIGRQFEQTKQRFSVGLTAITDVHEAHAQYDNAVTAEIRAENNIYTAEEAVRVITNYLPRNISILNTARFSTARPTPDSANDWQKLSESKNIDLLVAKIGVDIAKENINIAQAGHYPTIDLNGQWNKSKSTDEYSIAGGESFKFPETPYFDNKSITVNLTVPIYSGGATSSLVRQAQQNYVIASQDLSLIHRDTVRTVRNSYNSVIADVSAIKSLEQSVLSSEKALEATEAGFEVGTRTIVDVLNSTRNLYDAKRNLSSTRYGYIKNVLLLKRAAGTITDEDIKAINSGLMAE